MNTITVKGIGKITAKPDVATIHFLLSEINLNYGDSIGVLTKKLNSLTSSLKSLGVSDDKIRIYTLDVSQEHEYEFDKDQNQKKVFKGFKSSARINIHINYDNKLIGNILTKLIETDNKSDIRISFESTKKDSMENMVLEKAIKNAINKAEILAVSCGCKLGKIQSINQTWKEITIRSTRYDMLEMCCDLPAQINLPDIDPEDLSAEESVEVIWELLPS